MTLEEKIRELSGGVKKYFQTPKKKDEMTLYAIEHYINKDHKKLFSGKETAKNFNDLGEKIQSYVDKYQKHLDKLSYKAGQGVGTANFLNDALRFARASPMSNTYYANLLLTGVKTALETPAMANYVMKTGHFYDAAKWAGMKLISTLVPVIGPAMDINYAARAIRKRAIKQGTKAFLKEKELYEGKTNLDERLRQRIEKVAGPLQEPQYHSKAA